jgi:hypothetical protein
MRATLYRGQRLTGKMVMHLPILGLARDTDSPEVGSLVDFKLAIRPMDSGLHQ